MREDVDPVRELTADQQPPGPVFRFFRALAAAVAVMVVVSVVVTKLINYTERTPDESDIKPFIGRYVALVNASDGPGLGRFLDSDQALDVPFRLAEFGGQEWTDVTVHWEQQFPGRYSASVTAWSVKLGREVSVREGLFWQDGRWHMSPKKAAPRPCGQQSADGKQASCTERPPDPVQPGPVQPCTGPPGKCPGPPSAPAVGRP